MSPEEIALVFADVTAKTTPINGNPTDDDLTALREILTPILLAIPYDVNGTHNLVGLIQPTAAYTTTWLTAFPRPPRPTAYDANIANDATPVVRARMEAAHNDLIADYAAFAAAERGVKSFLQTVIDELWYQDLKHAATFYNTVTAHAILTHLDNNCGGLHPSELISLPGEMAGYYATAAGIPEYIYALERAQRKLLRGNLPMSDDALLAIASTSVLAAQTYPRITDEWEERPSATKTWANWKTVYNAAYTARKRLLLASGGGEPLSSANTIATVPPTLPPTMGGTNIQEATTANLDAYLDNLANAATQESTQIAKMAVQLDTLSSQMASLNTAINLLTQGLNNPTGARASNNNNNRRNNNRSGNNNNNNNNTRSNYAVNGYCWTHGYKVGTTHTSITCASKAPGHKDDATRSNTMNGSTANRGWDSNST